MFKKEPKYFIVIAKKKNIKKYKNEIYMYNNMRTSGSRDNQ